MGYHNDTQFRRIGSLRVKLATICCAFHSKNTNSAAYSHNYRTIMRNLSDFVAPEQRCYS